MQIYLVLCPFLVLTNIFYVYNVKNIKIGYMRIDVIYKCLNFSVI